MSNSSPDLMSRGQAESFAQGLYYLASVDGIDQREIQLIRSFLDEVGYADLGERLSADGFDLEAAVRSLNTTFLRRVFLRTAIALIHADGHVSDAERFAMRIIAKRFGLEADLNDLLASPAAIPE
jgi:hypothetical protein